MTKVKLGIIGAGFNGQIAFIQNFYKNKKCLIYGLAEARQKLRKKVAKKFKIKKTYSSHKDLIKDINFFDGVVIVTKRDMIGPLTNEFLKLKKPILTEKPMAGSVEQSVKLLRTAKKFRTMHKIGYNKIYDNGIIKSKIIFDKLIKHRTLGNIVLIKSHRLSGSGYDMNNKYIMSGEKNKLSKPNWPLKPKWLPKKYEKPYEKYLNLYCHNISLMRHFTGEMPKVVNADLSDSTMSIVNLKYKKFKGILETGFFTKKGWDETFEIYFEFGSLKIKLPPQHHKNMSASFILNNRKSNTTKKFKFKNCWSFKNQCDAFINDILKKKITTNKAIDATKDVKIIEKIWKRYLNK